ncbi:MAG: S9 family peptidase [Propionibacteriaceae bacterium]
MTQLRPPTAERRPQTRVFHDDVVTDDYEWLRDKSNQDVIDYITAENAYTDELTAHLAPLTGEIFTEIKARTQETALSVARFSTDSQGRHWWYYSRTIAGKNYPITCRVPALSRDSRPDLEQDHIADETIILDRNAEAEGKPFFSVGSAEISPNGELYFWQVDEAGDERYTLFIKNIATGELCADRLTDLGEGVVWAGDQHVAYTRVDEAWRPYQIWVHTLGTPTSDDALLYEEHDEKFWMGIYPSNDSNWLIISVNSKTTGEAWLVDTHNPTAKPRCVAPRRQGIDYSVDVAGDRLLIVHNDGAVDYQLAQAPLDSTDAAQWQTVIPGTVGVRISFSDSYRDFVAVGIRRNGLSGIHLIPRDEHGDLLPGSDLEFDEPIYTVGYAGDSNWDTDRFGYTFTSLVTPAQIFEYQVSSARQTLLKVMPVLDHPTLGAYNPDDYEQKREWATAADGSKIPLSIVCKKGITLDGSNPFHLYAYGSYEMSIDPVFSIPRLSLLDRGVVFAIAHIRGGGEMGRSWYENGKLMHKKNTFTDFVDCAKHVIATGYTAPEHLSIEGRSAGGLLMGAVLNLAPELFRCAHAGVPFVDALTSMLMPELPLTTGEWEEWGDPITSAQAYHYMKSYTPYENVKPVQYPAILVTTSLNDTRVLYVEPAKWVAQLRATAQHSDDRPLVMKCEMVAGHGGVSGRYEKWREFAFEYAWMLDQLGLNENTASA